MKLRIKFYFFNSTERDFRWIIIPGRVLRLRIKYHLFNWRPTVGLERASFSEAVISAAFDSIQAKASVEIENYCPRTSERDDHNPEHGAGRLQP